MEVTEMTLAGTDAEQIALEFLMADWEIPLEDQEWFTVLDSRLVDRSWYVIEVGVEGLPDKWVLQVYDTGVCDPNYTFNSPIKADHGNADLEDLPDCIATLLSTERSTQR